MSTRKSAGNAGAGDNALRTISSSLARTKSSRRPGRVSKTSPVASIESKREKWRAPTAARRFFRVLALRMGTLPDRRSARELIHHLSHRQPTVGRGKPLDQGQ